MSLRHYDALELGHVGVMRPHDGIKAWSDRETIFILFFIYLYPSIPVISTTVKVVFNQN